MLGFTGDAVVSDIKGAKVQRFDATYSAVMALENGKVDAVVADSEPAKNISQVTKTYPLLLPKRKKKITQLLFEKMIRSYWRI